MPTTLPLCPRVPVGSWRPGAWNFCKMIYGLALGFACVALGCNRITIAIVAHALRVLDAAWDEHG